MSLKSLNDVVQEHYSWASSDTFRIPLGWSFFDDATGGGVGLGEVCMMLAYSGVGKTWWACNVAINNRNIPTVFFSLEMQGRALAQRLAAVAYGQPTVNTEEEVRMRGESDVLERLVEDYPRLMIDDTPSLSLQGMSDTLDEVADLWGERPKLVIADYLELIKSGPALSALEGVDRISRAVKNFARSADIAFIVLHQTNSNESARVVQDWGGGRGQGSRVDAGHLALTRRAARFGGDIAADYTVAVFKPSLDPNMADSVRAFRENELHQQLLKNRGGSVLHLGGIQHHVDVSCWKITEIKENPNGNMSAINPVGTGPGHTGVDQWPAPSGAGDLPQAG